MKRVKGRIPAFVKQACTQRGCEDPLRYTGAPLRENLRNELTFFTLTPAARIPTAAPVSSHLGSEVKAEMTYRKSYGEVVIGHSTVI